MLYLHWSDITPKEKVPWLFNLYGQEYRELSLFRDEEALYRNELAAIQTLFEKSSKLNPEKIFQEAMEGWIVAEVEPKDIDRSRKAFSEFLKNRVTLMKQPNVDITKGDLDALVD